MARPRRSFRVERSAFRSQGSLGKGVLMFHRCVVVAVLKCLAWLLGCVDWLGPLSLTLNWAPTFDDPSTHVF